MENSSNTKPTTQESEFKNPDLERYVSELKEDTKLTIHNLREKSLMVSSLRCKWLEYYHLEKSNFQKLKKIKEKYVKSKNSNVTSQSLLNMKSIDKLAETDEKFNKILILTDRVKENIDFIEKAMNILDSFGFDIKNVIEIYKFEKM